MTSAGVPVVELTQARVTRGERVLLDVPALTVRRGEIIAVIGPNGAGKSTLFRMITGTEQPDRGKVAIGSTVKLAHVDQSRDKLANDQTVFEFVSGGTDILKVGKFEMAAAFATNGRMSER